jgi:hypothetical protein
VVNERNGTSARLIGDGKVTATVDFAIVAPSTESVDCIMVVPPNLWP